jgi:pantothenate kinase
VQHPLEFPFLLVNIGSGVSFLNIREEPGESRRVGGTSLGGGFFLGLAALANRRICSFPALLESAAEGDMENVDIMLQDLYLNKEVPKELESAHLLVSLGKLVEEAPVREQDLNKSLLCMVSYNIALHAFMVMKLHGLSRVVFTGFFMRNNDVTYRSINKAFSFFAGKAEGFKVSCCFVRHDGYVGALGCLQGLLGQ